MSTASSRFKQEREGERGIADFLPYRAHVSPEAILTAEGDLLRVWRVDGISFATEEDEVIIRRKEEMNMLLRSMASVNTAIWTHQVRRRVSDRLKGEFSSDFATHIDELYYEGLGDPQSAAGKGDEVGVGQVDMMANDLYVTLVYRPAPLRSDRINRKAAKRSLKEVMEDRDAALERMNELASEFESGLRRYGPQPLRVYQSTSGADFSEILEFLNFLITGEKQRVRVPRAPINEALGNAYLLVGTETLVIRGEKDRYAQLIDMKDYPEQTEAGMLNKLMLQDIEYVLTQSFSFMDKRTSLKFLDQTEGLLRSTEDGSVTQLVQLSSAKDEVIQGRYVMGEYHFTLMVFGNTRAEVDRAASDALSVLKDDGFLPVKVATATDAAFFAQLPCNWDERPRVARLTSMNFAGLSPFHNFHQGKRDGNPWGQAVTLFQTPSSQPLYFNFHVSRDDEDAYDKKTLGNTRVIGASGTGKTVLLNFLLSQLTKYESNSATGFGAVFFDKDRGAELAIRSMGGKYSALKNGRPTGFNPFQMEPTESNLLFLERWVASLVTYQGGDRLSATDEQRISHAVRAVMKMRKENRRLSILHQNLPEGNSAAERENSVSRRLERWIGGGALSWVADNHTDSLDLATHTMYGFDGTAFLDDPIVCPVISSYLLHRMEEMIDGRRFSYWMDEAWKWVDSPAFADFAGNKQLTIRKQNGFGVFATQMPSSLLESPIGAQLVQQSATEIYLPNPKAKREEYVGGFKLTNAEFDLVAEMPEHCRMFMVKQGHRSSLAKLDLGYLGKELSILSGSTDDVEILDDVLEEVGEDAAAGTWRPIFDRLRHERRGRKPAAFI